MKEKISWGIAGPGRIAGKFAEDLLLVDDAVLQSVGSRSETRAKEFATRYGFANAHGSYEALFEDDEVDIVYIATPHDSHAELTVAALEAGRAVLCEKPVAINRRQAESMVEASRASSNFFMEGFWSRFIPAVREVIERARRGDIGAVRLLQADFSFGVPDNPGSRLLDMDRGGGALLDVGVYPLFLAYSILGVPQGVSARAKFHETGADLQTSIILEYDEAMANLYAGFASGTNVEATVSGEEGRFVIHPMWHAADAYTLHLNGASAPSRIEYPRNGLGFTYEIRECHGCLRRGLIESTSWSHQDSLNLIGIADEVRRLIGLKYAADKS